MVGLDPRFRPRQKERFNSFVPKTLDHMYMVALHDTEKQEQEYSCSNSDEICPQSVTFLLRLLHRLRHAQNRRFVEMLAENLRADRQSLARNAAWHGNPADAGQVRRHRVHVG